MKNTLAYYSTVLHKDFALFCNKELQKYGLSQGLVFFILYIGKQPNCSPGVLSRSLGFDSGHTTRCLDKLVSGGFILREKNSSDKRAFVLNLTEQGQKVFELSFDLFWQWDKQIFDGFTQAEQEQLTGLLQKIVQQKIDPDNIQQKDGAEKQRLY